MKNLILNKNLLGVLAASVLAAIPFFTSAQITEKPLDIDAQKNLLEVRADDIIDSVLFTPTILNAEGKFEKLPVQQRYYYAGFPTDKTVVADEDNYSAVEKTATGYKVYAADTFVYADGNWKTIENDVIEPSAFDAVMFDRTDPTLGDLLGGVFKAHAQTYAASADDAIRCQSCTGTGCYTESGCGDEAVTAYGTFASVWSSASDNSRLYYWFDTSAVSGDYESVDLHVFFSDEWTPAAIGTFYAAGSDQVSATLDATDYDYTRENGVEFSPDHVDHNESVVTLDEDLYSDSVMKIVIATDNDYEETALDASFEMAAFTTSEHTGTDYDPYLDITVSSGTSTPVSTTTTDYASSTPGLTTTTAVFFLFFAIVFVLGGLIILSWMRDIFS